MGTCSRSEEDSDSESDNFTSASNTADFVKQLQNTAELLEVPKPCSPELSSMGKYGTQQPGISPHSDFKEMTNNPVAVQQCCASLDSGVMTLKELGTEKHATNSTNVVPLQSLHSLLQRNSGNKQEGRGSVNTLNQDRVRSVRCSRTSNIDENLSLSSSEVFNEKSLQYTRQHKDENPEEESAEDFQSLPTDDSDSSSSDLCHASFLIQIQMDSDTLDSSSMVKLQNITHEYERSIQKAKSHHVNLSDKVSKLEVERAEMKNSLENIAEAKFALECNQLELQTDLKNLKFQLKREQENHSNASMMYNTIRSELRRTEEHHQLEIRERQKVELSLRKLELETRILVNNIKQLEQENHETQRQLAQERSSRTMQEDLFNNCLCKQKEIEEEKNRTLNKTNETLSQLTKANEHEKELLQQNAALQEQLSILRTNLELSQANSSIKESHILEENEALKEQLEDAQRDLIINSEALSSCQNEVTNLQSVLPVITSHLENERRTRETLEVEVRSTRTRLAGAVEEAEHYLAAQADTEKALLQEKEEHQRLKDRLTGETSCQFETCMENEVHQVIILRQQLVEAQKKEVANEQAFTEARESFGGILSKLRSDCDAKIQLVEERNKELASRVPTLQDKICKLDEEKNERENYLRQLQKELTDSIKKLSMNEASLEVNTHYWNDLEKERTRLLKQMDRLKEKLEEKEDHCVQADRKMNSLKSTLDEREKELTAELKIHTKLGLRLAELEKEKGELNNQMEIEKKTSKKIAEQSRAVETCLGQEMKRNTELQKQMHRMRTLLKTAKKKLRDQKTDGAEIGTPMQSVKMDLGRHSQVEDGLRRMKDRLDDLQRQLEKEVSRSSQLEKVNRVFKDQLASLKNLRNSSDQLERSKRQLEEEVLDLRGRMETAQLEKKQAEQYRRDAEKWAKQEIKQKLDLVNLFLQSQSSSQEALDQIKAANEANMRSRLEQKIRELEGELCRSRTTLQSCLNQRDSTRTELERYRSSTLKSGASTSRCLPN